MKDDLVPILKSVNLKVTPQRLSILQIIRNKEHATIKDVFTAVRKTSPSISLATVYKNINTLVEHSILGVMSVNSSQAYYELSKSNQNIHVVCRGCGSITALQPANQSMLGDIQKIADDDVLYVEIAAYINCDGCRKKEEALKKRAKG